MVLISTLIILIIILIYIIVNISIKLSKLEQILINRNDYLNIINDIITKIDYKIEKLDTIGAFKSDDEIGTFFEEIKKLKNILNKIKN